MDLKRRFYDPATGRFTSVDPVTEGQENQSTYQYGWNNPIRFKDPDGMWPWDGLVSAFKKWYNVPLNKSQQDISRAASIAGVPAKTQGEAYKNALITGLAHAASGVQPGSFRRPADMYKPGAEVASSSGKTTNAVPKTVARVIPEEAMEAAKSLGRLGTEDVFVTAASDLKGIKTSEGIANRLTLLKEDGSLIKGPFRVIEFTTPSQGIASPVRRNDPGFIGGGRTAGGAAEFVLPNLRFDEIEIKSQRTVE